MKRIMIEVAYDGTSYCGWQIQPNGMTVEEKLNQVLSDFLGEEIRVMGASRTDSGVHAYGNVAVFDTESGIPPEKMCYALNGKLPEDIRIRSSRQVDRNFHPRYCLSIKTYEYHIQNCRLPIPTERLYTQLVTMPLDLNLMRKGAAYLVGKHDFASFCASGTSAKTTIRTVRAIDIESRPYASFYEDSGKDDHKIIIRVIGEGFLYNMVRIIAGTLIKVGLGVYPPEHVKEILEARDRNLAGETAKARGLFLKKIEYPDLS